MDTDKRPVAAAAAGAPYLPAELIPDIASHLTSLRDFFALRAACRAYRAALPPSRAVLAAQPPHLLVPHHGSSRPHLALVHLPRRRLLRFRESSPVPNAVLASDGARLLTFDPFARALLFTHLLSGERARAPDVPFLFSRAVLTGDLVLLTAPGWVGYCRLGDGRWREADCRLGDRDADLWCRARFNGVHMMVAMRSVDGVLYALLNTCQLAVAELLDNKVELKLLGGEVDEHVRNAWMQSKDFILGECAGALLIFKFKVSVNAVYKVFRWETREERWVRVTSIGRRTLFMSVNGFDAWLGPDSPGVRGDCIYEALPRAADWSEYSLVDGTCELVTIEYQGAPGVDAARTQAIPMMGSRGTSAMLTRATRMRQKLQSALEASALDIEDVSYQHAGHAAVKDNANETHFNIKVVSPKFEGQSLVKRHRMVYDLLTDELNSGLHAISIVAKTPKESGS